MIAQSLKERTGIYHEEVEKIMYARDIFNKSILVKHYKSLIEINYVFHALIEEKSFASLSPKTKEILSVENRRKLPALKKDIELLQLSSIVDSYDFNISNEDEALGTMYVMEGATLGGNVIKKHLQQIDEFRNIPFHYYGIYGNEIGNQWKIFIQFLDKNVKNENDCFNKAKEAFTLLKSIAQNRTAHTKVAALS